MNQEFTAAFTCCSAAGSSIVGNSPGSRPSQMAWIERREREYRDGYPPADVNGRAAILIDDGLATGASMRAAARALRPRAREVIVAVPVASERTCDEFRAEVDQIICATTPQPFFAVGMFYRDFEQTTDEEVRMLLSEARDINNRNAA